MTQERVIRMMPLSQPAMPIFILRTHLLFARSNRQSFGSVLGYKF